MEKKLVFVVRRNERKKERRKKKRRHLKMEPCFFFQAKVILAMISNLFQF